MTRTPIWNRGVEGVAGFVGICVGGIGRTQVQNVNGMEWNGMEYAAMTPPNTLDITCFCL